MKNEMGGARSMYGGRKDAYRVLLGRLGRARNNLEEICLDGNIIFKSIFKKWDWSMGWVDLAQDWDRWQDFVYAILDFRFA
jgi:hypothetical protein